MESASGNYIAEFLLRLPLYPKRDIPIRKGQNGLQSRLDGFGSRPRLHISLYTAPCELVQTSLRTARFGRCTALRNGRLAVASSCQDQGSE
jgi:hypothetical protein